MHHILIKQNWHLRLPPKVEVTQGHATHFQCCCFCGSVPVLLPHMFCHMKYATGISWCQCVRRPVQWCLEIYHKKIITLTGIDLYELSHWYCDIGCCRCIVRLWKINHKQMHHLLNASSQKYLFNYKVAHSSLNLFAEFVIMQYCI